MHTLQCGKELLWDLGGPCQNGGAIHRDLTLFVALHIGAFEGGVEYAPSFLKYC